MELPPIVSEEEWRRAHQALLAKEKEASRARDALAAERRRQPRLEFSTDYAFEGPDGVVSFLDLFEGRRQLIVYHFWFPPDAQGEADVSGAGDQTPLSRPSRQSHAAPPFFETVGSNPALPPLKGPRSRQ
jgi:predicted dithiol-disulfide oxidoreductase (DUF899 family)